MAPGLRSETTTSNAPRPLFAETDPKPVPRSNELVVAQQNPLSSISFPPEEITVPHYSYLLGLGDVPGELRRQALDALRVGDLDLAESRLVMMEHIYLNLVSMDETHLLKGLRRKMDITRGVIERTRSEVTAEVGRRRLNESVERLYERLGDKP